MKVPKEKPRVEGRASNTSRSARRFPWTKEEDALLGKLPDREVAEQLNRTLGGVRDRRKFLGKTAVSHAPQPFCMEREPCDGYARLFAAKSNQELRALLGWSYQRIYTRRRQLAGGKLRRLQPEWTLEEDRLLGTKPDAVLAKAFGRSVTSVRARRGKKRIRLQKDWRPEDDQVLGTRTDHEIALRLGRSVTNVGWRRNQLGIPPKARARPWTPEEDALLGSKPDQELARKFGRTFKAVEARRLQLNRPKPDAVFRVIKVARRSEAGLSCLRRRLRCIMNDQGPSASSENRLSDPELSLKPRGLSPGTSRPRSGDNRPPRETTNESKQLKIVVRIAPPEMQSSEAPKPAAELPTGECSYWCRAVALFDFVETMDPPSHPNPSAIGAPRRKLRIAYEG